MTKLIENSKFIDLIGEDGKKIAYNLIEDIILKKWNDYFQYIIKEDVI